MSKKLNQGQSQKLRNAAQAIVKAYEQFKDAPEFSTRTRNLQDAMASAANVARKLIAELDNQAGKTKGPGRAPDLPDTNRGDEDAFGGEGEVGTPHDGKSQSNPPDMAGGPPKGLTSTHSMSQKTPSQEQQAQAGGNDSQSQGQGGSIQQTAKRDMPGYVTGGVAERDDAQRHKKHVEEGVVARVSPSRSIVDETEKVNISYPIHSGRDTTNTSSDGAAKPDNYFAGQAEEGEGDAEKLAAQGAQPRKYDSENRVATETLEHAAAKAQQDENDPSKSVDEYKSADPSPVKQTEDDKEQQKFQGSRGPDVQSGSPENGGDDTKQQERQSQADEQAAKAKREQDEKAKGDVLAGLADDRKAKAEKGRASDEESKPRP